ncbi:MAG: sigma-54-dependent Fis family transcriptional regulator [Sporichthyaceae bacterium]
MAIRIGADRRLGMNEWARAVHGAREVLGEQGARMPATSPGPVRSVVYESWRRSRMQGLEPDRVAPAFYPDVELDSFLTRVAEPLVQRHRAAVDQRGCALALTDQEGRLLRRWTSDSGLSARLDSLTVAPQFSVAESHVGTTSAIALSSGSPVLVRGPEHFAEAFHDLTCAGAPIVHPVSRRTLGTLDVTCWLSDTNDAILPWVVDLVREVEDALRDAACRRERLLLESYLAHNRDTRHPLVTLDQHTIISNAAAARLLGSTDQALLWEHAARAVRRPDGDTHVLTLATGIQVSVSTHPVIDGGDTIGAVLALKQVGDDHEPTRPPTPSASLPGLVGVGRRWTQLCTQAQSLHSADRVLVVGEPGTGRTAVARAVAGDGRFRVLDARDFASLGFERWVGAVEQRSGSDEVLILRHIDLLNSEPARATDAALTRRAHGRVVATSEHGPVDASSHNPLVDTFCSVLEVAPLRERTEDLPALLQALTARFCGDRPPIRWMPDAVQALGRLDWPGNVTSLEAVVRRVLGTGRTGYVGAKDLPPDIVAGAARRRLAALEQAEVKAILNALRDANGNKLQASEALGIARSTLYRKMRALGLDLSASAY